MEPDWSYRKAFLGLMIVVAAIGFGLCAWNPMLRWLAGAYALLGGWHTVTVCLAIPFCFGLVARPGRERIVCTSLAVVPLAAYSMLGPLMPDQMENLEPPLYAGFWVAGSLFYLGILAAAMWRRS
jgi:hypothetical protein